MSVVLMRSSTHWSGLARLEFDAIRYWRRPPRSRTGPDTWTSLWSIPKHLICSAGCASKAAAIIRREIDASRAPAATERCLAIPPIGDNGFAIDLLGRDAGVRCWFGELEARFDSWDEALVWVERALSSTYRLVTVEIGGKACEWRLEPIAGPSAGPSLTTGTFVLARRWRAARTTARRNDLAFARPAHARAIKAGVVVHLRRQV